MACCAKPFPAVASSNCCAGPSSPFGPKFPAMGTPEPHYIPGYLGYVPQSKYRYGGTYGTTTHRILLDPCVDLSPRSLLNNLYPEHCADEFGRPGVGSDPFLSSQMALINSRVNSLGRQQYQPNMTPGYTGFVPRLQNVLGHSFSPACDRAMAGFEQEQWRDRLFNKELEALDGWRFCYGTKPWERAGVSGCSSDTPPPPSIPTVQMDFSRAGMCSAAAACGGPPDISILSAGRSPCEYSARRMWAAANEPRLKNLVTCGDIIKRLNSHRRTSSPTGRSQVIYPACDGMISSYNGHVPGEQFRIGMTYGSATRNAKQVIQPDMLRPLCFPLRT